MPDTLARVIAITAEHLAKHLDDISPESNFIELGADSLDVIELMMAIEDEFDIKIDDDTANRLPTVYDVVAFVERSIPKAA